MDASIVRKGPVGDQGDGPFSTGRGGQANIGATKSPKLTPADAEDVPEEARRLSKEHSHHVGRGGAGNEAHVHDKHKEADASKGKDDGFADKLKNKLLGSHSKGEHKDRT